jgi:hypothetical protein
MSAIWLSAGMFLTVQVAGRDRVVAQTAQTGPLLLAR